MTDVGLSRSCETPLLPGSNTLPHPATNAPLGKKFPPAVVSRRHLVRSAALNLRYRSTSNLCPIELTSNATIA
jgi:hypothetical protein